SPESFISITRIKDSDNYTYTHSVNVAVIAIYLGKRLGFSEQELHNLGFAGLMHDIGKMQIHEQILNKPGKLTNGEFTVVKMHALKGYMYLKSVGVTENSILTAVLHHHEKADGSGYPKALMDSQIPKFAKILSVVDVYDAITSDRAYHKGILPSDAMKLLFSWSGKRFNDALVRFFISIMGIYPAGTLIMLDTNELAVTLEPNKSASLRPTVLIVTDENMAPVEPYSFDLSSRNVATQAFHKSIVSAVNAKDFNINISQYVQQS
ncbi:MAG: HD-GYP domain-containing protein, partial [Deferribacteraceae bacterium]|nr:HD-GYP domain-containing protein [Deferribacteraceae bacterium]